MTRVAAEVRARFGRPVGLNLLENDAEAMFAVASAAGADFVRIKVYVGAMLTPFGVESGQAFAAIRARNACDAENVAIFADVHDRTGVPSRPAASPRTLDYAVRLGGADGLVLTGKTYRRDARIDRDRAQACSPRCRSSSAAASTPGTSPRSASVADGVIVSSSLKDSGDCVREIRSGEGHGVHGGGQARPLAD